MYRTIKSLIDLHTVCKTAETGNSLEGNERHGGGAAAGTTGAMAQQNFGRGHSVFWPHQ